MKRIVTALLISTPVFTLVFCTATTNGINVAAPIRTNPTDTTNNFVVLELFTSQGCSSCPPADKLVSKYISKDNIYPLCFHVDYWNRLGWTDPFSNKSFSNRQSDYASSFGLESAYTPQVVINGQDEMVGSEEDKIDDAIKKFAGEKPTSRIILSKITQGELNTTVSIDLEGEIDKAVLNVALVQNKTTTVVRAGENNGLKLTNFNVVREFQTIKNIAPGMNNVTIHTLHGIPKNELTIIIYLQHSSDRKIISAVKSPLG